jgi:hypothetical protein
MAPILYINLLVGEFLRNNDEKSRRYTTAMVWGVWNWNMQQPTTKIDGEPFLL